MLRKLTSPKKASRFAAATTSAAGSPQELSSLAADASPAAQRQQPPPGDLLASDAKPSTGDSQAKKKNSTKPPSLTKAEAEASIGQPHQQPTLSLDLQAVAKETSDDNHADDKTVDPRVKAPSPLLRTPRNKSLFDADDAKATSNQTPKKSKRDSLGLKSLVAKREKTKEETKPIKEDSKSSPKKKKQDEDEDDGAAGAPALSPIRRKPRPATDRANDQSMTATIRDATSLLSRSKRLASTRADAPIPPLEQPELHIIGEIVGGDGFGSTSDGFCCKWSVDYGNQWIHIAGDQLGQTQIDYANSSPPDEGILTWAHPLDLHFATTVFHGWPKLLLQVWRVDTHMKMNAVGYGFVHVPFTPGHHRLSVSMWRPLGSTKEELEAALLGHTPELLTDEVLFNTAWAERCRLKTIATGRVQVDLGVILRNFHTAGSKMDM